MVAAPTELPATAQARWPRFGGRSRRVEMLELAMKQERPEPTVTALLLRNSALWAELSECCGSGSASEGLVQTPVELVSDLGRVGAEPALGRCRGRALRVPLARVPQLDRAGFRHA